MGELDEKIYQQEIIEETPFPGDEIILPITTSEGGKGDNYAQPTTRDVKLPQKRMAVELLSTALNTRSRKILESFELQQSGGFQIGNFQIGISGDTRITPNGIVMRNKSGITTLAQDGETGDAIFAGQLRTGSLITGEVQVIDGNISLYNDGVLEIFIGDDGT